MGTNKRVVMYKCPFCDNNKKYDRKNLVIHVSNKHEDDLPEGFSALRYVFHYVNKKPLTYHGKCTECGKSTPWDENKGRYNRQCGSKKCHDSYVKKFEENMMRTRGTTRISSTAEGQKKMLANRKISGTYIWSDGTKKTYTGSYEKAALEFMDKVMELNSEDVMCPGPVLEYSFEGKTHIYITDFYYQPYDLVIEVKDGGDNPNKRNMPEYRAKQIAKEQFIIKHTNYNYLRLTNNNLKQLLAVFMDLKMQLVDDTKDRVIHVNENTDNPIIEAMNPLMSMPPVGIKDSDLLVARNDDNHTFAITDPNFEKAFSVNKKNKILEYVDFDELSENNDDDRTMNLYEVFKCVNDRDYIIKEASKYIGKEVEENFIYKLAYGHNIYTDDQIYYEATLLGNYSSKNGLFLTEDYLDNRTDYLFALDEAVYGISKDKENIILLQAINKIQESIDQLGGEIYGQV